MMSSDTPFDNFVKLTEDGRRERQRIVDTGDEGAILKFNRPPPPPNEQGGYGQQKGHGEKGHGEKGHGGKGRHDRRGHPSGSAGKGGGYPARGAPPPGPPPGHHHGAGPPPGQFGYGALPHGARNAPPAPSRYPA